MHLRVNILSRSLVDESRGISVVDVQRSGPASRKHQQRSFGSGSEVQETSDSVG